MSKEPSINFTYTGNISGQLGVGTDITQHQGSVPVGRDSVIALLKSLRSEMSLEAGKPLDAALSELEESPSPQATERALQGLNDDPQVAEALQDNQADLSDRFDVFIAHATAEKEAFVRPFAEALAESEVCVWYDEYNLRAGDSLRGAIDRALAQIPCAITVLSPEYFLGSWTRYELDGLIVSELASQKKIVPIWHGVTKEEVLRFSPPMANKLAWDTATMSPIAMARAFKELIFPKPS